MKYEDFLGQKIKTLPDQGFDAPIINDKLFPFQQTLTRWAIRKGRCALFCDTGLGKTAMQLVWAEEVCKETGKNVLILAPLAVGYQTEQEAIKFDIPAVKYCRDEREVEAGITVTNYERLHLFDPGSFIGIVLDESSILKSFMGKTKRQLVDSFKDTPYKLCCTATPAPNDLLELGNHAEFLGIMPSNEMIARWFINNSMHAGDYKLKPHGARDFYRWLSTWSMSVSRPSDIDCEDDGFILPALNFTQHQVEDVEVPVPAGQLFDVSPPNAVTMHRYKRASANIRAEKVADLVNGLDDYVIVWCDTNYEADALKKLLLEAVEVRGSDSADSKEEKLKAFITGEERILISKPEIAGFGLNLQHCHNIIFIGLSFSFERFYQAVRRCWRFGQKYPVSVHIIATGKEESIADVIWKKHQVFDTLKSEIVEAVREGQMDELQGKRKLTEAPEPESHHSDKWQIWLGDAVEIIQRIPSESVDFSLFSPPFSSLYIYTDSIADMGNSEDDEEFFHHLEYLLPELHRVTVPGRLCAIHCKDLPLYRGRDGAAGLRDFPGQIIAAMERCGWTYHSRVTIWKDPVTEMQRTKNHGLLHKILCKDSSNSRQGMADYLVVFRKWNETGKFPKPVNASGNANLRFDSYIGEEPPGTYRNARDYSIQVWQRYASPVWFDINQMRVLPYRSARASEEEKHICPLQLDVIERAIHLWTNPDDIVLDPFAGIGSVGYCATKMERKFIGIELKNSYFQTMERNLRGVEMEFSQGRLL